MAFEVRCPDCRAKLKLDQEPEADESIECPKCGHAFDPTAARMGGGDAAKKKDRPSKAGDGKAVAVKEKAAKKAKGGGEKPAAGEPYVPKKKKAKKQKSNRTILILGAVAALVILACIGGMAYFLMSKAGKVEDLMVHVPGDCNIVRGVNTGHIGKYKNYKADGDRAMAGPPRDCWDAIVSGLGLDKDTFASPEYAVVGKTRARGQTGTILVYRTPAALPDPKALGAALGGAEQQVGGQTAYKVSKAGALNGAVVYASGDRIVVVVLPGALQSDMAQKSAAGKAQPDTSFWAKMGTTGKKVAGGSVWALVRADGDLKDYIKETGKPVAADFKQLTDQMDKAPLFGTWVSFGAKITFGAAVQCESPEAATAVAKMLKDSPIGQGDETAHVPNSLSAAWGTIKNNDMSEFRSNLRFYSTGECVFLESKMGSAYKDRALQALAVFAKPDIASSDAGSGGNPMAPVGMGSPRP